MNVFTQIYAACPYNLRVESVAYNPKQVFYIFLYRFGWLQ